MDPNRPFFDRSDEDLWELCLNRVAGAFLELYQRYAGFITAFFRGKLSTVRDLSRDERENTAQDLSQDVWVKVAVAIGRGDKPANVRAWLFTVAYHVFIDWVRRRGNDPGPWPDGPPPPDPEGNDPSDQTIRGELDQKLRDCIDKLPRDERSVIELDLADVSSKDQAEILDVLVGRIYQLRHRAHQHLRECVGEG